MGQRYPILHSTTGAGTGMRALVFLCLSLLVTHLVSGQELNDNRVCLTVSTGELIESSEAIARSSITIPDTLVSLVKIEMITSKSFKLTSKEVFNFQLCYRVIPSELTKSVKLTSIGKYDSAAYFRTNEKVQDPLFSKRDELFSMGELNHGGQISRGITVGNTQDLFVNSSLNLNLEGKLSEDLNIRASITDQFIPYQPEGNTQQLQDFDNIFVELYNDKFSVIGGDVVYKNDETHFLKYLKNVQGGAVKLNLGKSETTMGISAAKGQFSSVNMEVFEGVQGPYKVPSETGDQFVIIIANSEKVFLDGKLLTRGYNRDYVIDYNQSELTFTSNIVITKYSRIRVDYEYASRNYTRSVMNFNHSHQLGKLSVLASYYREADNRNKSLLYDLSDDDKLLLESVGNNTDQAVVISANKVPFSKDKVLYNLIDTIDQSMVPQKIFKFSNTEVDSLYSVTFSNVGDGLGSYSIKEYLAQGRIYAWVGKGRGSFEPYRQLAAPTKKEMLDLKLALDVGEYSQIYVESALSNHDLNLYSDIDNETNAGYALKAGYRVKDQPIGFLKDSKLSFFSDLEYLDLNFKEIDRFRRVEFDRDWSFNKIDSIPTSDLVLRTGISIDRDGLNKISYGFNYRQKQNQLVGAQHNLALRKSLGKIQLDVDGFYMDSELRQEDANWKKLNASLYYRGKLEPGYRFLLQQNTIRTVSDSILSSANYFSAHEFFVRSNPLLNSKFEVSYSIRKDQTPVIGEMNEADYAENVKLKYAQFFKNGHNLSFVINYRQLENKIKNDEALESVSGRLDWTGDIIKSVFRHELNYAVANVRVPRREYVYVEVPTGEGTHTWRDENLDGIKDLDEFYEAIHFDERNFIKLYVNTTEFLDAYENIFNYRATLSAPASWRSKAGILNLLGKISNTTSWSSNYRTTEDRLAARLIPFIADIDEDQVLSLREAFRSTFFINKSNPKFGLSGGYANFRKKFLYTNGFEGRSDKEYSLSIRWNIARKYNIKLSSLSAKRLNRSDYLQGRNYDINEYKLGPSFSWQPKPTVRLKGQFTTGLKQSSNSAEQPTNSNLNEIMTELKMGRATSYMVNFNLKYSRVSYSGDELSPLGYEMLQGLRPGDNYSWLVGWQQKLIAGLQLNIYYEGRKPEGTKTIHSGRASISALF